jgi:hypothetical protein
VVHLDFFRTFSGNHNWFCHTPTVLLCMPYSCSPARIIGTCGYYLDHGMGCHARGRTLDYLRLRGHMLFTVKVGPDGSWRCQILRAELQPCFGCIVLAPSRNTIRPPFSRLKQEGSSVPVFSCKVFHSFYIAPQ